MTEKPKEKVYEDSISNWPEEERPRERLLKFDPHSLTNAELLAILLRVGVKGKSAGGSGEADNQRGEWFKRFG